MPMKSSDLTDARKEYLRLLRAGLWDEDCDCEVSGAAREIAIQQATTGLVLRSDGRSVAELAVLLVTNGELDSAVAEISGMLSSAGIPSVLLKGQGLARNYPQPELRCCGDIDLYVGRDNYGRACGIMKKAGGKCEESIKHLNIEYKGVPVELHRVSAVMHSSKLDRIYQEYADEGLTENLVPVEIGGRMIDTPSDDFNVLFVFYHFFYHFMHDGVGFRQICDWTVLLHRRGANVDREKLRSRLDALGLMDAWQTFGNLAVRHLGLPQEEMPFYDAASSGRADRLLTAVFEYGNFGRTRHGHRKVSRHYLIRKAGSLRLHTRNFFEVLRMFPDMAPGFYWGTVKTGIRQVFIDLCGKF